MTEITEARTIRQHLNSFKERILEGPQHQFEWSSHPMLTPTNAISYDEIADGDAFENLVADYFRSKGANVPPPGIGPDGGVDILVTFQPEDSIVEYSRKWVVQCKFHQTTVGLAEIATVNIPTLIHEYQADGYLLICRNGVSSTLTTKFQNLNSRCRFKYRYEVWPGAQFLTRLNLITPEPVLQTYFPNYYAFLQQKEVAL